MQARAEKLILAVAFCVLSAVLSVKTCRAAVAGSQEPQPPTGISQEEDGDHRAGHPKCLAHYAQPSSDLHYAGGYLGGGTQFHGCRRFTDEGTWGRDYCDGILTHRPWLKWSHGRRFQGGSGAYKTDGPRLFGH